MKLANKVYLAITLGAALELKEQAVKSNSASVLRRAAMGSSAQVRILPGAGDVRGPAKVSPEEKIKAAEGSLRMVVYLSCWGPN